MQMMVGILEKSNMLKPVNGNIVVKVETEGEVTEEGFYAGGEGQNDKIEAWSIKAVVVAVSFDPKIKQITLYPQDSEPFTLKVGDKVQVAKWEGQKVMYQAEEFYLIKTKDVQAIRD